MSSWVGYALDRCQRAARRSLGVHELVFDLSDMSGELTMPSFLPWPTSSAHEDAIWGVKWTTKDQIVSVGLDGALKVWSVHMSLLPWPSPCSRADHLPHPPPGRPPARSSTRPPLIRSVSPPSPSLLSPTDLCPTRSTARPSSTRSRPAPSSERTSRSSGAAPARGRWRCTRRTRCLQAQVREARSC